MKAIINEILAASIQAKRRFLADHEDRVIRAAEKIAACFAAGHKLLLFGNGGSAADAQHIAAEFVNRFRIERPPLAAIALTTDTSVITSIGNDYSFDEIFAKQVAAIGRAGDIAIGISTSGNSVNVVRAIEKARGMGLFTMGWTGRGGKLADAAEMVFPVASDATARVQEVHALLGHILCDLTDRILFPGSFA